MPLQFRTRDVRKPSPAERVVGALVGVILALAVCSLRVACTVDLFPNTMHLPQGTANLFPSPASATIQGILKDMYHYDRKAEEKVPKPERKTHPSRSGKRKPKDPEAIAAAAEAAAKARRKA